MKRGRKLRSQQEGHKPIQVKCGTGSFAGDMMSCSGESREAPTHLRAALPSKTQRALYTCVCVYMYTYIFPPYEPALQ